MAHDPVKVGVNGFGRIGRLFLRNAVMEDWFTVVGINDPLLNAEAMAYLLKYDSVHGRFEGDIQVKSPEELLINGKCVKITNHHNLTDLCWGELNADIVLESSGNFTSSKLCECHLNAGAKIVIISAPTHDETQHIILGVNENLFDPTSMKIISNGSCTTNCIAPLAKLVNDMYGIEEGFVSTIHAVTASQRVVDGPCHKDLRAGRAALMNIIPTTTGATEAVVKVIPELKGKLSGMAFRVPVENVSVIDFTVKLKKPMNNLEDLAKCIKKADEDTNSNLNGILGFTCDPVVSSDFNHCPYSCVLDITASQILNPNFVKLVGYYDNEWAYAKRLTELIHFVHCKSCEQKKGSK